MIYALSQSIVAGGDSAPFLQPVAAESKVAKKSMPAWVDEDLAGKVDRVAREEGLEPAQILEAATEFYMVLPEVVRREWHQILSRGTDEEINLALREVTRALVRSHLNMSIDRGHDQPRQPAGALGVTYIAPDFDAPDSDSNYSGLL